MVCSCLYYSSILCTFPSLLFLWSPAYHTQCRGGGGISCASTGRPHTNTHTEHMRVCVPLPILLANKASPCRWRWSLPLRFTLPAAVGGGMTPPSLLVRINRDLWGGNGQLSVHDDHIFSCGADEVKCWRSAGRTAGRGAREGCWACLRGDEELVCCVPMQKPFQTVFQVT